MRKVIFTFACLIVVLTVIECACLTDLLDILFSRPAADAFQQSDSERMQELRQMIQAEISDPTAKESSQCNVIAFGSKPCGGPATYLVYSTARSDESKLKSLAREYNELSRKYNLTRPDVMSNCLYVTEPAVQLIDGMCKLKWDARRIQ
jgi:hypothetical protein